MTLRWIVLETLSQVLSLRGKPFPTVEDEATWDDLGMDEDDLVLLVAKLHDELGVNPILAPQSRRFPASLGALVALYATALTGSPGAGWPAGRGS